MSAGFSWAIPVSGQRPKMHYLKETENAKLFLRLVRTKILSLLALHGIYAAVLRISWILDGTKTHFLWPRAKCVHPLCGKVTAIGVWRLLLRRKLFNTKVTATTVGFVTACPHNAECLQGCQY